MKNPIFATQFFVHSNQAKRSSRIPLQKSPNMFIHRLLFASVLIIVCCITTLTNGATLPNDEVEALRSTGKILGKTNWNFDIDPCSRGNSWLDQPTRYYANNVTCDCSFNNNTTCHVTHM
ncbi:hypothetical protein ERO13_D11G304806v2 [Gossypium hirsutum]|uniref:Uncharacterized protein n=1 Tax=Gossypium barbadense TaxID=3634 RepID=A0A5J5PM07_GOSBA|nr:hypothetical protein ES319_D11G331900v1 [Gossypium barbadense]KAG4123025.1 hypothetical protein ERO13_D11G304806v2 [Gossypium hirsutum]